MSIQMGQNTQRERVPHNDVSLLAATRNEPVFVTVNETINSFLVEVECLVFENELVNVVNVDEAIK